MFQRQAEVKVRDRGDQENRVQQFPKTPKHGGKDVLASKFVTPAPRPRVALGAKSTNVHHRQFTSAKTGKRHSPVTASSANRPVEVAQEPTAGLKVQGGAALRAQLDRALKTGVDVPDVEYAPPPVREEEEGPYEEPEWMTPMDWGAYEIVRQAEKRRPFPVLACSKLPTYDDDSLPKFEFMEDPVLAAKTDRRPAPATTSRTRPARSQLGGFAAPTLAAQARAKVPVRARGAVDKENVNIGHKRVAVRPPGALSQRSSSSARSKASTPVAVEEVASTAPEGQLDSLELLPIDGLTLEPLEMPDLDPQSDMEVDFDVEDEDEI